MFESMSRRKVVIELSAPEEYDRLAETLVSPGHRCPRCHGDGTVVACDADPSAPQWRTCPVCKGSGELDAVVTVEWKASRRVNK